MNGGDKLIINVGRQLGSGGRMVAQLLAKTFDARFYDKEILELAAKESGFSEEYFEQNDECKGFFRSLLNIRAVHLADSGFYQNDFSQEALFKIQSDAIRKAAAEGNCVFVGRCADYVLRDMPECVNIFVTAPIDIRIDRVAERHHCSRDEARHMIEKGEHERATYYNYYTGKHWGASESYHLCIDASVLGIEETADYIAQFINARK